MGLIGAVGRLVRGLLALGVLLALAGAVAWAVLPGGPLAADAVDRPGAASGATDAGVGPPTNDARTTTSSGAATSNPWGEAVVTVDARNPAAPERNVTPAVVEAIEYWEANAGYADYRVEFRVAPDVADPDVVVWYNETIDCPAHGDAVGCAPLVEADARPERPVAVEILYDPADNRRQVRNTAIHEFGHVLGVGHCEEPRWVMASGCDEPVPDAPDADERELAWRNGTIAIYVDDGNVSASERTETREQVGHAVEYLSNRSEGAFPPVSIHRVDDRFDADVVVTFSADDSCRDDAVTCYSTRGRDYDGDGRMEYYTGGTIRIDPGSDVEARGWYARWALSKLLSPRYVPEEFEDASYQERRSRWWE